MIALCRYQVHDLTRSHRWVAPLLVYILVLAMVYAQPAGPAPLAFGVTAGALIPIGAWLTRALLGTEDPIAQQVTVTAAGSRARVQAALLASALALTGVLAVLAVLWAAVANPSYTAHGAAVLGGLGIHALFGLAGVGLGALLSPPLVVEPGPAVLGIVGATTVSVILRVSPAAWALRVLEHNRRHGFAAAMAGPVVALGAAGLACVLIAFWLGSRRR
ncbi:MAG TPA: hypothetical protein VFW71_09990 [Actinomycetota bacterium]|nr:hypothetical protein [Actinomycetota bacterium]